MARKKPKRRTNRRSTPLAPSKRLVRRRTKVTVAEVGAEKQETAPRSGMPRRKRYTTYEYELFKRIGAKKRAKPTDKFSDYPPIAGAVRRPNDPCSRRKQRRAVLLAIGQVNKPGGAPGPYRRRTSSNDPC